jgi:hypothetical protein
VGEKYSFDPETGVSRHKKTGMLVCSRCLLTGVEVPLIKLNEKEWRCINTACKSEFVPKWKG